MCRRIELIRLILLHEMFGGRESRRRKPSSKRIELEALLPGYVSRLTRKGMSVRKLFKEYHSEYPDGLQLSSFKRAVRRYKFHIKVVGHVEHYAADQMYVDFAGDRLEVVDEMTGETKKAEVFAAFLPFSHYTYCEAVWSLCKEDLIKGCENAMLYFEGRSDICFSHNVSKMREWHAVFRRGSGGNSSRQSEGGRHTK